jgi:hypothetical protein
MRLVNHSLTFIGNNCLAKLVVAQDINWCPCPLLLPAVWLCLASVAGAAGAQTYDAAADFSITSNPNGVWSYGWSTSRGSNFNRLPTPEPAFDGVSDLWTGSGVCCSVAPSVFHNGTNFVDTKASCCAPWPVGGLGFHPGIDGENSIVRWTAPSTGVFKIKATFSGLDYGTPPTRTGTTTDVAVLHNGVQLWSGNIVEFGSHYDQFFSGTVLVHAGDTIDFTLGWGMVATGNDYPSPNYNFDSTGQDAVITSADQLLTAGVLIRRWMQDPAVFGGFGLVIIFLLPSSSGLKKIPLSIGQIRSQKIPTNSTAAPMYLRMRCHGGSGSDSVSSAGLDISDHSVA